MNRKIYNKFIVDIKQTILKSRYQAAKLVNKELLLLYFEVGKMLSLKIKDEDWGAKVMENISNDLQSQLPGLRGFSQSNLKNMKQFYEAYHFLPIRQSVTVQLEKNKKKPIRQSLTVQFKVNKIKGFNKSSTTKNDKFLFQFLDLFSSVSFTHHILLLNRVQSTEELLFYIKKSIDEQWSVRVLEHHLDSNLFYKKGKLDNNFKKALPAKLHEHALQSFKDEYLLDFININDSVHDERVLEQGIVANIRDFILTLGKEFSFVGNQYRLMVGDEEFFIDLLFYHRGLRALVAIELKTGKFKPEYAGKMNFYLAGLNKFVKLPHENPSIGIILCREKNKNVVEFAFQDITKPIGVGTYKVSEKLPPQLKKYLPKIESLKKLIK